MNVSCAHGGINDVKDHISTNNHKSAHSNRESKFIFRYYAYSVFLVLCTNFTWDM